MVDHFYFLSSPDNTDESVHANAGGSFIESENTGGHLRLCQWKTARYHQVCVFMCALVEDEECFLSWIHPHFLDAFRALVQHVLWLVRWQLNHWSAHIDASLCPGTDSSLMWAGGRRGFREKWPPESTETQTGRSLFRATTSWCPAEKHTRRRSPVSPPTTRRSSLTASPSTFSVSLSRTKQQVCNYTGKSKSTQAKLQAVFVPDEPDVLVDGFDGNWYLNRENVQLSCQADANPAVSLYQWRLWVQLYTHKHMYTYTYLHTMMEVLFCSWPDMRGCNCIFVTCSLC